MLELQPEDEFPSAGMTCPGCTENDSRIYNSLSDLSLHIKARHNGVDPSVFNVVVFGNPDPGLRGFFKCGGCSSVILSHEKLMNHCRYNRRNPTCRALLGSIQSSQQQSGSSSPSIGGEREPENNNQFEQSVFPTADSGAVQSSVPPPGLPHLSQQPESSAPASESVPVELPNIGGGDVEDAVPSGSPVEISCPLCPSRLFSDIQRYRDHVRRSHSTQEVLDHIADFNTRSNGYCFDFRACSGCSRIMDGTWGLRRHVSRCQQAQSSQVTVAPAVASAESTPPALNTTASGQTTRQQGSGRSRNTTTRSSPSRTAPPVGPRQPPLPTVPSVQIPHDLDVQIDLLNHFSDAIYTVSNRVWRRLLYKLSRPLLIALSQTPRLGNIRTTDTRNENLITLALHLLPGLVYHCYRGARPMTPAVFLRVLEDVLDRCSADDARRAFHHRDDHSPIMALSSAIVSFAVSWKDSVAQLRADALDRRSLHDNEDDLTAVGGSQDVRLEGKQVRTIRSINSLVRERRLGTAMAAVERLQEILHAREALRTVNVDDGSRVIPADSSLLQPQLSFEQVQSVVAGLHPPSSPSDEFTPDQLASVDSSDSNILVDNEMAWSGLKRLPVGSASGPSGWTYGCIVDVFLVSSRYESDAEKKERVGVIKDFCNRMLSGTMSSPLWLRSRVVLIPKKGGGWRPLGIGEAWYRLVGRVAMKAYGKTVSNLLEPLQLGCGMESGSEIAGRLGQLTLDAGRGDLVMMSLDVHNAFNSMNRQQMLRGILEFCPALGKWFRWAYGMATPLVWQYGEVVGTSCTGCRQGDPLAVLCFCVGLQYVLLDIKQALDDKRPMLRDLDAGHLDVPVGVFAYIDDANIFLPPEIANVVAVDVITIFERYGLPLSQVKCRFLGPGAQQIPDPVFTVEARGLSLIGVPTGVREYREERVLSVVRQAASSLPALSMVDPWAAWNLLRTCIVARVAYLARTVERDISLLGLAEFDSTVDRFCLNLAGIEEPELMLPERMIAESALIRSFPLSLGGLGIIRYSGIRGEYAILRSREVLKQFVSKNYPDLWDRVTRSQPPLWPPLVLGGTEESTLLQELDIRETADLIAQIRNALSTTPPTDTRRAAYLRNQLAELEKVNTAEGQELISWTEPDKEGKSIVASIVGRRATQFVGALHRSGRHGWARWFAASRFHGSGSWLTNFVQPGVFFGSFAFHNADEYRVALRTRLLIPPLFGSLRFADEDTFGADPVLRRCPHCDASVNVNDDPLHALDCRLVTGNRIRRHGLVCLHLAQSLRSSISRLSPQSSSANEIISFEPQMLAPYMREDMQRLRASRAVVGISTGQIGIGGLRAPDVVAASTAMQHEDETLVAGPGGAVAGGGIGDFLLSGRSGPQSRVSVEDWCAARRDRAARGLLYADIGWHRSPEHRQYIDVTVVNSAARSYRRPVGGAASAAATAVETPAIPDEAPAAVIREHAKRQKYSQILAERAGNRAYFVPFVVEATGRAGPSAAAFLHGSYTHLEAKFEHRVVMKQIGSIIAQFNAKMILRWERGPTSRD